MKKQTCFSAGDMQDAQRDGYANGKAFGEMVGGDIAVAKYRLEERAQRLYERQALVELISSASFLRIVKLLVVTLRDLSRSTLVPKGPKALLAAVITSLEMAYLDDDGGLFDHAGL
jgi:hypothetical protein